jgi:hypothetical protein
LDKGTPEEVAPELFSERERRSIVRSFIEAYIRGKAGIDFPKPGEHNLTGDEIKGEEIVGVREELTANIGILVGTVKNTTAQFDKALSDVFALIIASRNGERLKGEFLSITDSDRLTLLENRVSDIEALLEELQTLVHVRGDHPP